MGLKLTNNATTTLASAINSSALSLTVAPTTGALFPTLGSGDYFYATLQNTDNTFEIVKVTARSTDTMTIVRAQESTTARSFASGSRFEIRVTVQNTRAEFDDLNLLLF